MPTPFSFFDNFLPTLETNVRSRLREGYTVDTFELTKTDNDDDAFLSFCVTLPNFPGQHFRYDILMDNDLERFVQAILQMIYDSNTESEEEIAENNEGYAMTPHFAEDEESSPRPL